MDRISGRSDDMLIIRGVNVFPSQLEEEILKFEHLAPHYQLEVNRRGHLDSLAVRVELKESGAESRAALPDLPPAAPPHQVDGRDLHRYHYRQLRQHSAL
jgi:phenylacetate-coenzyme A ligase PaaK-like adenylate-forming protein